MRRLAIACTVTAGSLAAALMAGCGASQEAEKKGPDYCKMADEMLKKRLGPEYDAVVTGRRLPPKGCALIYRPMQEEFAGEVAGESSNAYTDQRLAILLPDGRGKPSLQLIGGSEPAPGPVLLKLSDAEIDGEAPAELVVEESGSPDYRGLRLFTRSSGRAKEIFAANLKVKTPEGLDIAARWAKGEYKGAKAIILDGAGTKKIFTWNRAAGRYTYNEVATNAVAPKPAAPPSAAAASAAAPVGSKAVEGAKKAAPTKKAAGKTVKKAADKAKKAADDKADKLNLGELNL